MERMEQFSKRKMLCHCCSVVAEIMLHLSRIWKRNDLNCITQLQNSKIGCFLPRCSLKVIVVLLLLHLNAFNQDSFISIQPPNITYAEKDQGFYFQIPGYCTISNSCHFSALKFMLTLVHSTKAQCSFTESSSLDVRGQPLNVPLWFSGSGAQYWSAGQSVHTRCPAPAAQEYTAAIMESRRHPVHF